MLPIPFEKFIPSFFNRDSKLLAMSNRIESHLIDWKNDLLQLNRIIDPAMAKNSILGDIGEYLNAGLLNVDSDRTKREKIRTAIEGHKKKGLWKDDAKPKIDSIAGGDSQIVRALDSADWILFGHELNDLDNYWGTLGVFATDVSDIVFESDTDFIMVEATDTSYNGTMGTDNIDDYGEDLFGSQVGSIGDTQLGIDLIGSGTEIEIAGNIYIDVDNKILTDSELEQIKLSLDDVVPSYYKIYLGYFNNNNQFIIYDNGIIH